MNETIGVVFIGVGLLFDLLGCIGLVRLPDVYNRLQAATKCVTLGTCMVLVGVPIYGGLDAMGIKAILCAVFIQSTEDAMGIKAILCAVFILLTSPTGAHALARGSHKSGVRLWKGSVVDKYAEDNEGKIIIKETKADSASATAS